MSAILRKRLADLRAKFARTFGVPPESVASEVTLDVYGEEYGQVGLPGSTLPTWTTGRKMETRPAPREKP